MKDKSKMKMYVSKLSLHLIVKEKEQINTLHTLSTKCMVISILKSDQYANFCLCLFWLKYIYIDFNDDLNKTWTCFFERGSSQYDRIAENLCLPPEKVGAPYIHPWYMTNNVLQLQANLLSKHFRKKKVPQISVQLHFKTTP